jgi:hypothetical protein
LHGKDFEVCALNLKLHSIRACIITIYRAPTGNFNLFINELDTLLRKIYIPTVEYIICGDINKDYLTNNEKKSQWEAMLVTYNLTSTVNFPSRCQKISATAIDNIL